MGLPTPSVLSLERGLDPPPPLLYGFAKATLHLSPSSLPFPLSPSRCYFAPRVFRRSSSLFPAEGKPGVEMGVRLRSGFYLGKKLALLLALLPAALLLALLVLAILYGRCAWGPKESDQLLPGVPTTAGANASAEPATRPSGPWDQQRLPRHVTPIHYSLLLWPHLAPGLPEPRTHSGQVNITVRCHEATSTVLLHSAELTYRGASVWGPLEEAPDNTSRSIPLGEVWMAPANQYLVLELLESLRAGSLYELRFAFQGKIQPGPDYSGLFLNTYQDEGESR